MQDFVKFLFGGVDRETGSVDNENSYNPFTDFGRRVFFGCVAFLTLMVLAVGITYLST